MPNWTQRKTTAASTRRKAVREAPRFLISHDDAVGGLLWVCLLPDARLVSVSDLHVKNRTKEAYTTDGKQATSGSGPSLRLDSTRRVEYNAASRNAKKKRIAVEIVELILKGGDDAAACTPAGMPKRSGLPWRLWN